MKTISVLREELAAAQAAYLAADIEHPTQSTLAKDDLANARHEYQHACVEMVERFASAVIEAEVAGDNGPICKIYTEITGEDL